MSFSQISRSLSSTSSPQSLSMKVANLNAASDASTVISTSISIDTSIATNDRCVVAVEAEKKYDETFKK